MSSCKNCMFMHKKRGINGNFPWVSRYYCTKDGEDRLIGEFSNYTGSAFDSVGYELEHRICKDYASKVVSE